MNATNQILNFLLENDGSTVNEILQGLNFKSANTSRVLTRLEKQDYIEKRKKSLTSSGKGGKTYNRHIYLTGKYLIETQYGIKKIDKLEPFDFKVFQFLSQTIAYCYDTLARLMNIEYSLDVYFSIQRLKKHGLVISGDRCLGTCNNDGHPAYQRSESHTLSE